MNKKNIYLIIAGIALLTLQFNVRIGNIIIDIFSDAIAFILILCAMLPMAKDNETFKKSKNIAFIGLGLTLLGTYVSIFMSKANTLGIVAGLTTIATIYFTYYFNEALMLQATNLERAALTRSLRIVWLIFGGLTFVKYLAMTSDSSVLSIAAQALTAIYTIYYCITLFNVYNGFSRD